MRFADPWVLLFLIVVPLALWFDTRRKGEFVCPSTESLTDIAPSWRLRLLTLLPYIKAAALTLAVIAAARPQVAGNMELVKGKGVDIILAVDVSTSMLAEDFTLDGQRQNRISVVKQVVKEFVNQRPLDRLGMVVFAGRPYTLAPLSWDHAWLMEQMNRNVEVGMIEDGTAIGSALGTALNRLRESQAASKVIILLTDGRNNAGKVPPLTAAEAARALDVKVYTIGAGSKGPVPYPVQDIFGRTSYKNVRIDIDDELLQEVAEITGGRYYRATGTESLREVYREIDKLEKTDIETRRYVNYRDVYPYPLFPATGLFAALALLKLTVVRRLP